jgi:carbonic anhydrase
MTLRSAVVTPRPYFALMLICVSTYQVRFAGGSHWAASLSDLTWLSWVSTARSPATSTANDSRSAGDPAQVFGLELGDAIVARTAGGRVTPAVLQDLAWISYLHEVKTPGAGWFELAVMHHTDCGSGLFADDELRHGFAARGGYDDTELAALAVLDPAATVPVDVEKIVSAPAVSPAIRVSGYSYDVKTGLITVIVPPRSR